MSNNKIHKSKKRFFPNTLTILNMFLGFIAIILIMKNEYFNAGLLILLAGIMDIFDGKIARLLGISSKFGVEFDSLADLNEDGIVNVLDVIQSVNLILNNEYQASGDINSDGLLNVMDVVLLVNMILNN